MHALLLSPDELVALTGSRRHAAQRRWLVDVSDEVFDAIYRHGDQLLRDAMDIATATGRCAENRSRNRSAS